MARGLIYCKSRIMNRDIIAVPHAHCLSGSLLAVATHPSDLKWLAIVLPAQRGAQSHEAVSSRFAFRVALGGHSITICAFRFLGLPPWEAAGRLFLCCPWPVALLLRVCFSSSSSSRPWYYY